MAYWFFMSAGIMRSAVMGMGMSGGIRQAAGIGDQPAKKTRSAYIHPCPGIDSAREVVLVVQNSRCPHPFSLMDAAVCRRHPSCLLSKCS